MAFESDPPSFSHDMDKIGGLDFRLCCEYSEDLCCSNDPKWSVAYETHCCDIPIYDGLLCEEHYARWEYLFYESSVVLICRLCGARYDRSLPGEVARVTRRVKLPS